MSDNDSDRDAEEEDDASDNDLEILGEQSGTVHVTNSTGDPSGGTETCPIKKQGARQDVDRHDPAYPRGPHWFFQVTIKTLQFNQHDVNPDTLKKRLLDFPDQFLQV